MALLNPSLARIDTLRFRDPAYFVAGELYNHLAFWQALLKDLPQQPLLSQLISEGVKIEDFLRHFKGKFRNIHYVSPPPPPTILPNAKNCGEFEKFVSSKIL